MHADAIHPNERLQDKLEKIYALRGGITVDLSIRAPYYRLLCQLDDPHKKLPPVIHIAGTNGKGSVHAYLRAILEAAGYRVHAYTSPHLVRFNERITLAGQEIGDSWLESLLDETMARNAGGALTFFEITTAMAFAAFARTPADVTILETGLGGRLDCTNVVENPAATIITPIGYDHTEFLGNTLPLIAGEKAGIMKRGVPCIIGRQDDESVQRVFAAKARELSCPLHRFGHEWLVEPDDQGMWFSAGDQRIRLPLPALTGPHQPYNAGMALAALALLQEKGMFRVGHDAFAHGLGKVRWPGRLQQLNAAGLRQGWELWIDGGHNESAARVLAAQAAIWRAQDQKPLHLVVGMKQTKDAAAFLRPLLPHAASFTFTAIGAEKSIDINEMEEMARRMGASAVHSDTDLNRILNRLAAGGPSGRVLVTGSLYLVGEALKIFNAAGCTEGR